MGKISHRFPQIFVAIYSGCLSEISNIRQFGFWLLNHAAFEDVPVEKPNEAGILITIDPNSKAAGIVFGYLLDPFLDESDTFECLSRAHAYWLEGRYCDGVLRTLAHLDLILRKRSRQARRDPEYFENRLSLPTQKADTIRPIRENHLPIHNKPKVREVSQ